MSARRWSGGGRIVARSHDFDRFFGQHATPEYLQLIRSVPHGVSTSTAKTVDGREMVAAWERLDNGWTVGIGAPGALLEAPLRQSILMAGLAGLVLLAAGLLAALWLSRRIAGAIDAATEDAGRLAQEQQLAPRRSAIRQVRHLFVAHQQASLRLENAAAERGRAMAALHAEIARRDGFLAMLAHELRNPLAPLTNAHRLIERAERLGDTGRMALEIAQRQTRQLTRLVDDLLDLSRLTSGKIALRLGTVPLNELVREAIEDVRPDADAHSQRLRVEMPDDPVAIEADAARVRQILDNLLVNAVKFGRDGGEVRLVLEATEDEAVVSVTDDGVGLDPARLGELFKPFSQLDPGLARTNGGLGLGLALVRQLVALQGGAVRADSDGLNRGATFTVRLPRKGPPESPAAAQEVGGLP
jgi:signal transduction histidine kinase